MNFSRRNRSIVDFLFMLTLFGAFAIAGLFAVVFGARVYESTVAKMDVNYSSRTALSYVTEKVRSHDYDNGVDIRTSDTDEDTVLILKDMVNDRTFITYMYEDDGYLKEFTADENYDFDYGQGTKILKVKEFKVTKAGDALYHFDIVDEYDNRTGFYVTLYSNTGEENIDE